MKHRKYSILIYLFSISYLVFDLATVNNANAQVTTDGTTNTNINSVDNQNFTIEQGDRAGGNLFHSFQDFSVPSNGSAVFNNAVDIDNIFSRVTGGNISNIDGLIQSNGSANLFLINPAGIIFGENSRLDVGGSFYGGSADSILFPDGEFSASDLNNPTLTINAPIGLGFRDNAGDVVNRSNFNLTTTVIDGTINPSFEGAEFTIRDAVGLEIDSSRTIALLGGNVILENAAGVTAPGGNVELGGLTEAGDVTLNEDGSLTFPEGVARGDVTLTDQARVRVAADGGGNIRINARNLELREQSELYAGIAEGVGSPEAQAGDVIIDATESVRIFGSGGVGEDTSLDQNAFALLFNDYDTAIRNVVGFRPNQEEINLPNLGRNPNPESSAIGNAGNITIETETLEVSDRGSLTAKVYGQGNTGDINVTASDITIIEGDILNQVISGSGNTGNINFATDNLTVIGRADRLGGDSSFILADTRSLGDSGNINITASNLINLDGASLLQTQILDEGVGDAGDINITSNNFNANGAFLQTNALGIGNPGSINLNVAGDIFFDSVLLNSALSNQGTGNSGDIAIDAFNFNLVDGSEIRANIEGQGNAGNIQLEIDNEINFDGSAIAAEVTENATGNAGIIEISANSLSLNNGSEFNTETLGEGNGGTIAINTNSLDISDRSIISAATTSGSGGNIDLIVKDRLDLRENSIISAEALNLADGGNINIDTNFIVAFPSQNPGNGNDIIASAAGGDGGNITIAADSIIGIFQREAIADNNSNDIDASSDFGLDGTVSIFTPETNTLEGIRELSTNIIQTEQTTASACGADDTNIAQNSLIVQGRGGVQQRPNMPLTSDSLLFSGKKISNNSQSAKVKPMNTAKGKIVIARGVKVKPNGDIYLTAHPTGDRFSSSESEYSNCDRIDNL